MIRSKLKLALCLATAFALAPLGCGDDKMPDPTEGSTGEDTTAGPGSDSESTVDPTTSTSTTSTSTTTNPTTTTTTTGVDPCEMVEMKKDAGEECQLDCECKLITSLDPVGPPDQWPIEYDEDADGKCFVVPLIGGLCGQCVTAEDCEGGGCTIPNPLASAPSYCNDGGLGDGCDVDGPNTCQDGLVCGTVLDAAGILTVSTCGECQTSADCTDPMLPNCAPTLNVAGFTGHLACVADGSIEDDNACVIGEDVACAGGVCGVAVVMGVIEVGICGHCSSDADCMDPTPVCSDPFVDIDTIPDDPLNPPPDYMPLQGPKCVPA